jgi:serine/threonine protein kinase
MKKSKEMVNKSFLKFVSAHDSLSQLSLSVNDSAGNMTFEECYKTKALLGSGGFADVYRCQHKLRGHDYAVKEIFNDNYENGGEKIREEINTMKRLQDGCHIIRLLDVFREPDRTLMIMEEAKGGDLLERIYEKEVFSESDARRISRLLLEAIHFCHKKKIAHRDVKPENILLTSKQSDTDIKLADFGCAKLITSPNCLRTFCGSFQYTAPELYTNENGYGEQCDLWSVGVVIYILLGGYAPFDGEEEDLPEIVCRGKFAFQRTYWKDISNAPRDVIRRLLVVNPDERATCEETLDSKWLRRRDMESLNLDGSSSTFDAWVRRQNESSQTMSTLDGSYSAIEVDLSNKASLDASSTHLRDAGDVKSEGSASLSLGDL